jgi:hypothetical protein
VDDDFCPVCGEDVGSSSHYHCSYCLKVCGMMGCGCGLREAGADVHPRMRELDEEEAGTPSPDQPG